MNFMANRQYKDTVFRAFFNHKREIAELYQAIRPEDDVCADDITITTLDDVFLDQQKNDLSFLWRDQSVVLVEHQSSINPNMPYRLLIYSALVMPCVQYHVQGTSEYLGTLSTAP